MSRRIAKSRKSGTFSSDWGPFRTPPPTYRNPPDFIARNVGNGVFAAEDPEKMFVSMDAFDAGRVFQTR
jgi:hypothetical protein